MPQQANIATQNNFSKGLITEATGLNFPENAVTDADNCVFHRIGNATRRPALDYELNFTSATKDRTLKAISLYKWNNAGGDGSSQIVVNQVGSILYFYKSSNTTTTVGLSTTVLGSLDISTYKTISSIDDVECQYSDGNGYLFVFHPGMTPIYVTYTAPSTFTATSINIQIRDLEGITEPGVKDQDRPVALTIEHQYNLQNQGWSSAPVWSADSTSSVTVALGSRTFTVQTGLTTIPGELIQINGVRSGGGGPSSALPALNGSLTSYNSGTGVMVINVTSLSNPGGLSTHDSWTLFPYNAGLIDTWNTDEGNYPSNADIWWRFKDDTGLFDPATTQPNVTLSAGAAPKGYYILDAFNQDRQTASGIVGLTGLVTTARPRTGSWFQGRLWYAGVDGAQAATGDQGHYSWTETIYFSQTIIKTGQFGKCFQVNDLTSDELFAALPTDGGTIVIQGAGVIQKLFPLQNGLLVFATNGIWYITGSQGIGFAANDYAVNPISNIQTISHTSFVNVQGYPMWWNSDGVYTVGPDSNSTGFGPGRGAVGSGGLSVQPITYTNIKSFYDDIPSVSKRYAHGAFDPINWEIRWLYKSTAESSVTDRYTYDRVLVYNVATQAFYPWSIPRTDTPPSVNGIIYVQDPGVANAADPKFKYYASLGTATTFAEERLDSFQDWVRAGSTTDFDSYFVMGWKLPGQGSHKFQVGYLNMFVNSELDCAYTLQAMWDFATGSSSGKFTSKARTDLIGGGSFGIQRMRHKIRGRGFVVQFKISSVAGLAFDTLGWVVDEKVNTGL